MAKICWNGCHDKIYDLTEEKIDGPVISDRLPAGYDYALEFRHPSWDTEGPWDMLKHYDIAAVMTDYLKAVELLTIDNNNVNLEKQISKLKQKKISPIWSRISKQNRICAHHGGFELSKSEGAKY